MEAKSVISIKKLKDSPVFIHTLLGIVLGYFLLHPISMVIYWFELNSDEYNLTELLKVFLEGFKHSFSLHMMPMSVAFSILGALIGLGSGLYYKSIKQREYLL